VKSSETEAYRHRARGSHAIGCCGRVCIPLDVRVQGSLSASRDTNLSIRRDGAWLLHIGNLSRDRHFLRAAARCNRAKEAPPREKRNRDVQSSRVSAVLHSRVCSSMYSISLRAIESTEPLRPNLSLNRTPRRRRSRAVRSAPVSLVR